MLAVCLGAAGCNSSPYAASVNGQVIKETALYAQLGARASSPGYVAAVDRSGQGSGGVSVAGDASGTYNSSWVASVLTQLITDAAVRQHLVATKDLPGPAMLAAAQAVDAATYSSIWLQFSPSLRESITRSDASTAMLGLLTVPTSTLRGYYQQYRQYFFATVCVRQILVSVTGAHGSVDLAASRSRAEAVVSALDLAGRVSPLRSSLGAEGGAVTCYTPAQLETQVPWLISTIMSLAPGRAAPPHRTAAGYQVVAVERRSELGFTPQVRRALSQAVVASQGGTDPALDKVVAAARVQVNQGFGSWRASTASGPGQVVPPNTPVASAPAPKG